jgi:hypothetical protein
MRVGLAIGVGANDLKNSEWAVAFLVKLLYWALCAEIPRI